MAEQSPGSIAVPAPDLLAEWRIWYGIAGERAWLEADNEIVRQEITELFAGYETESGDLHDSGVFIRKRGSFPRLSLTLNGEARDPSEMFAGPEWKRFTRVAHPTRSLYSDTLFGDEASLEIDGNEIVVLRPEHWHLYLFLAHGWLMLQSRTLAVVHAAVAATNGTFLVLVGPSGAGKSTLSFALMERGADSFGDESAVFCLPDLTLYPWPRPLHMRPGGLDALGASHPGREWYEIRPGDPKCLVDLAPPKANCPGDRVAFYFLDGFADLPRLAPIGGAEASRRLLKGMVYGDPDPFERLSIAADMVNRYPCWKLTLGKPADTAAMLLDHAGGLR